MIREFKYHFFTEEFDRFWLDFWEILDYNSHSYVWLIMDSTGISNFIFILVADTLS